MMSSHQDQVQRSFAAWWLLRTCTLIAVLLLISGCDGGHLGCFARAHAATGAVLHSAKSSHRQRMLHQKRIIVAKVPLNETTRRRQKSSLFSLLPQQPDTTTCSSPEDEVTSAVKLLASALDSSPSQSHNSTVVPTKKRLPRSQRVLPWLPIGIKNGLASGLATMLVKAMLQPFDTIKTLQQMSSIASKRSVLATGREIIAHRGIIGLWAGTFVSAVCSAPSNAVFFGVFSVIKQQLTTILPPHMRILAVGIAAIVGNTLGSFLRVPFEVYKQRLQGGIHQTLTDCVMYTIQQEGILGLYTSGKLSSQIIRDVPNAVLTALMYDMLQRLLQHHRRKHPTTVSTSSISPSRLRLGKTQIDGICGAIAGGLGSLLTTPMDVIKTRLMTSHSYTSVNDVITRVYMEEGMKTFFAGTSSRLIHKVPANGMFYAFYEIFRYALGAVDERSAQ